MADKDARQAPLPALVSSVSNVAASATSVTIKAANAARRGLWVYNDSENSLYIKCGAVASLTSYSVKVLAGGYWEMPSPIYTGAVDGIWGGEPTGNARVTELT
jgi:hypothetical protein